MTFNDPMGDEPHSDWYESRGSWYDQKDQYAPMRWRGYPVFKPQTTRSGIEQIMEWNAMASNYYSDLQAWVNWNHFLSQSSSVNYTQGQIDAFISGALNGDGEQYLLSATVGGGLFIEGGNKTFKYVNGTIWNPSDGSLARSGNGFVKSAVRALNNIGSTDWGASVIGVLQKSSFTTTIREVPKTESYVTVDGKTYHKESRGMVRYDPINPENARAYEMMINGLSFSEIGSSGYINWDPRGDYAETKGLNLSQIHALSLGHELYHSFEGVTGTLDRRMYENRSIELSEIRGTFFENYIRGSMDAYPRLKMGSIDLFENDIQLWINPFNFYFNFFD